MQHDLMKAFLENSYLFGSNAPYIESLYESYLENPSSVSDKWQRFFSSLNESQPISHAAIREQLKQLGFSTRAAQTGSSSNAASSSKQSAVDNLIAGYRRLGHLNAELDPLGNKIPAPEPRLNLAHYGLTPSDLSQHFTSNGVLETPTATLKDIVERLKQSYCGHIGVEYAGVYNDAEYQWIQQYVEQKLWQHPLTDERKRQVLQQLTAAETLEKYLDRRFIGQKRFSIEGGESLIPALNETCQAAAALGVKEVALGMAHRGRLNVSLNIMGRKPKELISEFEGTFDFGETSSDVKYHMGFSSDIATPNGSLHLTLGFNPSHLEFINPVVMGSVRARQDRVNDPDQNQAMPVLIHGDGAFSGQGVVMETLSMSQTYAYGVGGTVHIILNNQVAFTTSEANDSRSSTYCSDLAKMIDAPVLHVNGDDTEAVVAVMRFAVAYRMRFHKDIVIDLVCYRRLGHNESDEASATQPLMYGKIRQHPTTRAKYAQELVAEGVVSEADAEAMITDYRKKLELGEPVVELLDEGLWRDNAKRWAPYLAQDWTQQFETGVPLKQLQALAEDVVVVPETFHLQRQVAHMMAARAKMAKGQQPLDWGFAETLAYASLLDESTTVRLSGQDVQRGTFAHRHAVLHDQQTSEPYSPLKQLANKKNAHFYAYNSLLSETGSLGFEYGYACTEPESLVIWEAQFGDFANGAQVIIDQFISSGWQKWGRLSGLTMLLPHGYEGMGPEHSSARLERFLQLSAQSNMQVCVPSTPAQIFHLLRRQVLRKLRVPLIVMTPKSLLRHKLATSTLEDLSKGHFREVIPEVDSLTKVKRVILCSGKVYYELLEKRREHEITDIAIIRIEQLYPFPYEELKAVLSQYAKAKEVVWCQEEPMNQGAWYSSRHRLTDCLQQGQELSYAGRAPMAAPAPGYLRLHKQQQEKLIQDALQLG